MVLQKAPLQRCGREEVLVPGNASTGAAFRNRAENTSFHVSVGVKEGKKRSGMDGGV